MSTRASSYPLGAGIRAGSSFRPGRDVIRKAANAVG
jgi:hypothetical protein